MRAARAATAARAAARAALLLLAAGAGLGAARSDVVLAAECGGQRECRCGDTVVEDYVLPANLGPCAGHGLRVRRRVVLDGGGHVIRGSGARGTFGVQVDTRGAGSKIMNLAVTGFERGIRLVKVEGVRVSRVAAHGNGDFRNRVGYGIDLSGGASRNVLERVQVFDNADEGIHLGSGAHENLIVEAQIYDNSRENVYFLRNHGNVLRSSELRGAGSASIYIKHAARTVLQGNRISDGIVQIRGAARDTRLIDNVIERGAIVVQGYRDKDPKVGLRFPSGTLVRGGRVSGPDACVRVEGGDGTTLERVTLRCDRPLVRSGGAEVRIVEADRARPAPPDADSRDAPL